MAATYEFPSDLLAGQEELHQVRAELLALLKRLPWSVEPLDGFSDDHGWRKVERPASPGWTPDEQAEVEKLRERERELAVYVTCHRFWSEVTTAEKVDARMTLKHVRETDVREPDVREPDVRGTDAQEAGEKQGPA
ncbi:hypothetical protein O1Q96_09170 [Streptomyces sp. Qhu-G9]|uniref:hypothetical protein n=1 Tax=Streptomyces sp. Qhu-G9 TaxID=3452799 RepID=UPI0022AC0688|nr:hypothetical protein [Streptomyces aurantiacus]WAU79898.1 hypothetical protein O1Q96_09170 [Streptomyces aurantiacus]